MKETKKAKKQRILDAVFEYNRFIRAHFKPDHPDFTFEPKNFFNWAQNCEVADIDELKRNISFIKRLLDAASGRDPVYCEGRSHFLKYAEASLKRRFPDKVIDPDEFPF